MMDERRLERSQLQRYKTTSSSVEIDEVDALRQQLSDCRAAALLRKSYQKEDDEQNLIQKNRPQRIEEEIRWASPTLQELGTSIREKIKEQKEGLERGAKYKNVYRQPELRCAKV